MSGRWLQRGVLWATTIAVASIGLTSCGGLQADEASSEQPAGACESFVRLAAIKLQMDKVDQKVLRNRPDVYSLESIRASAPKLAKDYEGYVRRYNELYGDVQPELEAAQRLAEKPASLDAAWQSLASSLNVRRFGIEVAGKTFARVSSDTTRKQIDKLFKGFVARLEEYQTQSERLNDQLQARLEKAASDLGLEQTQEGIVLECP